MKTTIKALALVLLLATPAMQLFCMQLNNAASLIVHTQTPVPRANATLHIPKPYIDNKNSAVVYGAIITGAIASGITSYILTRKNLAYSSIAAIVAAMTVYVSRIIYKKIQVHSEYKKLELEKRRILALFAAIENDLHRFAAEYGHALEPFDSDLVRIKKTFLDIYRSDVDALQKTLPKLDRMLANKTETLRISTNYIHTYTVHVQEIQNLLSNFKKQLLVVLQRERAIMAELFLRFKPWKTAVDKKIEALEEYDRQFFAANKQHDVAVQTFIAKAKDLLVHRYPHNPQETLYTIGRLEEQLPMEIQDRLQNT